jgi:hypothetical protein
MYPMGWGSHGGEDIDCGLLGCEAECSFRRLPKFRRNLKMETTRSSETLVNSTRPGGVTKQKATVDICPRRFYSGTYLSSIPEHLLHINFVTVHIMSWYKNHHQLSWKIKYEAQSLYDDDNDIYIIQNVFVRWDCQLLGQSFKQEHTHFTNAFIAIFHTWMTLILFTTQSHYCTVYLCALEHERSLGTKVTVRVNYSPRLSIKASLKSTVVESIPEGKACHGKECVMTMTYVVKASPIQGQPNEFSPFIWSYSAETKTFLFLVLSRIKAFLLLVAAIDKQIISWEAPCYGTRSCITQKH